jgi:hypothetical protein
MLDGRVSIRGRGEIFSLRHRVKTGSGTHPASQPMGTGDLTRGVKRPGREAEHSPPCSTEVKNAWGYTSTPPHAFRMWYILKHRDSYTSKFTFPDRRKTEEESKATNTKLCNCKVGQDESSYFNPLFILGATNSRTFHMPTGWVPAYIFFSHNANEIVPVRPSVRPSFILSDVLN